MADRHRRMSKITAEIQATQTNTAPSNASAASLVDQVNEVLDLIRPAVQSDGGDVELVDITPEGLVRVRLHGACVGCPSSIMTLQSGIERNLKQRIPGITGVQAVT